MMWGAFRLSHVETIGGIRRCWPVVAILLFIQIAIAVRFGNAWTSALVHAVSTPFLLYLSVRSVIPSPSRDVRDPHYDVFYAPLWGLMVSIIAGSVHAVLLLLALTNSLFFLNGAGFGWVLFLFFLIAWIALLITLYLFGFGFAAIASHHWDGFGAEWMRASRHRRWLAVRMLLGPGPILPLVIVAAAAFGLIAPDVAASMPDLQRGAAGLVVLSIQTYGIMLSGSLVALAYLRDPGLPQESVDVFS